MSDQRKTATVYFVDILFVADSKITDEASPIIIFLSEKT